MAITSTVVARIPRPGHRAASSSSSSCSSPASLSSRKRSSLGRARKGGGNAGSRRAASAVTMAALSKQDELKMAAAAKAVESVRSGMVVGLGTGSTAAFAVDRLGELLKSGEIKDVVGVPTSNATEKQARGLGIPLGTLDEYPRLDIAIDGADEVDAKLGLVKGRGGALLREKMVEMAAEKFIVIVDESKLVDGLGGSKLAMPVEVVQFCHKYLLKAVESLPAVAGCRAELRMAGDGKPYVTDNSNYIVDLYFEEPIKDAAAAAEQLSSITGVVEHGLFLGMATSCVVAKSDGIEIMEA